MWVVDTLLSTHLLKFNLTFHFTNLLLRDNKGIRIIVIRTHLWPTPTRALGKSHEENQA